MGHGGRPQGMQRRAGEIGHIYLQGGTEDNGPACSGHLQRCEVRLRIPRIHRILHFQSPWSMPKVVHLWNMGHPWRAGNPDGIEDVHNMQNL
eukprot:gene14931-biopygen3658